MEKILWVDDIREPIWECTKAKTYSQAIEALEKELFDYLYLDHDLGNQDGKKTGYDILCWLECHTDRLPKEIILITGNPSGRERMELVVKKLYNK